MCVHVRVQAPNEARFAMRNPCPFPVEVFSLDFDKQYLADEDILLVRAVHPCVCACTERVCMCSCRCMSARAQG